MTLLRLLAPLLLLIAASWGQSVRAAEPLKIAYSDWPGWVAWEIAIQKKWFDEAGVPVTFSWMDYVASMDAYVAGKVDAVCMTNGDALVTGASGKRSIGILINDYSNGNDMLVAKPGIASVKDLAGKKIGVETGFVCHLLTLTALQKAGMAESDVTLVNVPTNDTPTALASGDVDAIAAWQPNSGQALKQVPGSTALFTSADEPGIIYALLCVSPESLQARRDDWQKVVGVWYRIVDYLNDDTNFDEALGILAARVGLTADQYEGFYNGTHILGLEKAKKVWQDADGFGSVYGSSRVVDEFNLANGVYDEAQDIGSYLDPSLTTAITP